MHFVAIDDKLGRGLVFVVLSEYHLDAEGVLEPLFLIFLEWVSYLDPGRREVGAESLREGLDADVLAGVFVFEAELGVEGEVDLVHFSRWAISKFISLN